MNWEREAGARADALNQAVHGVSSERATALGRKDKAALGELPP